MENKNSIQVSHLSFVWDTCFGVFLHLVFFSWIVSHFFFACIFQSLHYMWRLVDFQKKGYITIFEINYFFREVSQQLLASGTSIDVADVKVIVWNPLKSIAAFDNFQFRMKYSTWSGLLIR